MSNLYHFLNFVSIKFKNIVSKFKTSILFRGSGTGGAIAPPFTNFRQVNNETLIYTKSIKYPHGEKNSESFC